MIDTLTLEYERLHEIAENLHALELDARKKLRELEDEHRVAAGKSSMAYMALEKAKYPKAYK
jgi:hypothetical protein